jgi:broad specificity phosphatase PhoE
MLLLLVRHGLTDWNESGRLLGRSNIGLNARGRGQAAALGRALADFRIEALLASPQRRTQETAAAIAAATGLAVQTEDALDEVWLAPQWQGRTFAELAAEPDIRRMAADPTHECDAIEPAASVRDRVARLVDEMLAQREGATIALVSHGDPLRILVAHHLGMALGNLRRLTISPGSVSAFAVSSRGARIFLLNWRPGSVTLADTLAGVL